MFLDFLENKIHQLLNTRSTEPRSTGRFQHKQREHKSHCRAGSHRKQRNFRPDATRPSPASVRITDGKQTGRLFLSCFLTRGTSEDVRAQKHQAFPKGLVGLQLELIIKFP